jgi:hypothetical protein
MRGTIVIFHQRTDQPIRNTRRPLLAFTLAGFALVAGAGCNFGSGGGSIPTPSDGITVFGQAILPTDGEGDAYPGYANYWDLDTDFSIASGGPIADTGTRQFDYALTLTVGATPFPTNQAYADLSYAAPALGTADGLNVAIVYDEATTGWAVGGGTYSLAMEATRNSRVRQTLDLTSAVPPITLFFDSSINMVASNFADEDYYFQAVIRDTANGLLDTVVYRGAGPDAGAGVPFDLSAYAGRVINLSFEARMTPYSMALIDDVTVVDDDGTEYVVNGDFETGDLTGWSRNTPSFYRNVTTAPRTLENLEVTRSFYTYPVSLWGRMVDVYTNPTAAQIDTTVSYEIDLASNGTGVIYDTPNTGAPAEALTSWDGAVMDAIRDVGWVFGSADSVTYLSDDGLDNGNGDDRIIVTFDLSVPAGGSVSLAHFLIMSGDNTGLTAADTSAMATAVDTEAQRIYDDFFVDADLTEGMTQAQIDGLVNF